MRHDSTRKRSKTVARADSSDRATGQTTKEQNTPPSPAGLVPSHATPQGSSSGTGRAASGEGQSAAESCSAVGKSPSNLTGKSGMQGPRDGDTDTPRGAGDGKNPGQNSRAKSGGEMGTKPHGNANVPRKSVNGRQEDGRDTGPSTTSETSTQGTERASGTNAATLGPVAAPTDSAINPTQANAASMYTGPEGNSGGEAGVHMNANQGTERMVRDEGRENNGSSESNSSDGKGRSVGSKEVSMHATTDLAADNEGHTTTRTTDGHALARASGTQVR
ncbi:hypothetical protein K474DRAFT_1714335 [Panus rudis PR-1116 ss-1]|nr:hypothetical protein K474DRAFT_1714335 [Panus rudis PR-1116 ss-1]